MCGLRLRTGSLATVKCLFGRCFLSFDQLGVFGHREGNGVCDLTMKFQDISDLQMTLPIL
jgi:hypothetical protein